MKYLAAAVGGKVHRSPPVWGAWVEIAVVYQGETPGDVAPRVGGVG